MIVTVSADPPSEIVSVLVKLFPPLIEVLVVDKSVTMLEGGRLEPEVAVVVGVAVTMLEVGGLELGVTKVLDVLVAMLVLKEFKLNLELEVDVVFRAGHPENLVSRRTGH